MRGDGRVFKRGQLFWVQYYFRGKQVREPGGFDGRGAATEAEARKKLKARMREIHGERYVGPQVERLAVADVLDSYKAHLRQKGAKSLESVAAHLKPVEHAFSMTRAVDVTTDRIRKYVEERLADKKQPATVNRGLQALRAAFRLAMKEGRLSRVPYFPMLREDNARAGFFERGEFEAVATNLPALVADIARFAYSSGWRKGEILGLRWEMVDRAAGEVRLRTSKNGEGRTLPLEIGELRQIVERRWAARECTTPEGVPALSEYVFHVGGRPVVDFKRSWATACKAAGVPGKLFHDLRRTAVRDLIRGEVHQAVAMQITGHKTDAIFRRYNITSDDDKREALRRLAAYRASRPAGSNVIPLRQDSGSR
jgi:integrase